MPLCKIKNFCKYFPKILLLLFPLILQSCNSVPKVPYDCGKIHEEIQTRYDLFPKLTEEEIKTRSQISVQTYSELHNLSVFSKIVKAIKEAPENTKLIPIDLRNYDTVNLGNIVVSNIKSDVSLNLFLNTSKYSQGFFALVNFGKNKITIFNQPYGEQLFDKEFIKRSDLQDVELVFNLQDSKKLIANMKFTKDQKISILAKNIQKPFRLDLREASNNQFSLGKKWIMSVYDVSNSDVLGGKKTGGYYLYVNNDEVKNMKLNKFNKSKVACYSNANGPKFENTAVGEF